MNDSQEQARAAYIAMAALAGAISSLSVLEWKAMTWAEVAMTILVGSTFAAFAVPYLIADVAGIDITSLRSICFFTYLGATGANSFLPILIRLGRHFLVRLFGSEVKQ